MCGFLIVQASLNYILIWESYFICHLNHTTITTMFRVSFIVVHNLNIILIYYHDLHFVNYDVLRENTLNIFSFMISKDNNFSTCIHIYTSCAFIYTPLVHSYIQFSTLHHRHSSYTYSMFCIHNIILYFY